MEKKVRNIIIRMPNWIGDAVMATPVIEEVRRFFPEAEITLMCQGIIGDLFLEDPRADSLFRFKKISGWIHQKERKRIIDPLKKGAFDLGILLTNSLSSAWWFYRGGVKERLGFSTHMRSFLLKPSVRLPKNVENQHLVKTYKELLIPLGITPTDSTPTLFLSPEEELKAENILQKFSTPGSKWIGINPGAAFGSAKCWLPDRFRALIEKILAETPHRVVCFGDQAGAPLVKEITEGLGERVLNMAGRTTIRELMALIKAVDVFLTNDSGPMHIAAALKVPLLALFGSTSDVKTGPYMWGEVIHKHTFCSPCYKRVCPIDFQCMKKIEVDEVYTKLMKLLK